MRPDKRNGPSSPTEAAPTHSDPNSVPAQLRRRRDAALRCEPLATGYRDPYDEPIRHKGYRPAWIITDTPGRVAVIKGPGVRDVLRAEGIGCMWSAAGRGFVVDLHRVPDASCALELAGYHVRCRERDGQ